LISAIHWSNTMTSLLRILSGKSASSSDMKISSPQKTIECDIPSIAPSIPVVEILEDRRLLSGSPFSSGPSFGSDAGQSGFGPRSFAPESFANDFPGGPRSTTSEISFSPLPTAIQTGLTNLASTDGDSPPTSTTEIHLGTEDGIETYTIDETNSSNLTVDSFGNTITQPSQSSTTFGAITNSAVIKEINTIASALGLTAPTSSSTVTVLTSASGATSYAIHLDPSSSSSSSSSSNATPDYSAFGRTVVVDSNGNPAGDEILPLSVFSAAIQNGLTSNAPAGATELTSTSPVHVQTIDGVRLYTAVYSSSGVLSAVTVNSAGTLTSKPTSTTVDFSTLPTVTQSELKSWAAAEGVTTTIADTQQVIQTTEPNGSVLYTVQLEATASNSTSDSNSTTDSNSTETYPITLTVDSSGNPTVLGAATGYGGFFGGTGFSDPSAFPGQTGPC
jgi:hypothetical protein